MIHFLPELFDSSSYMVARLDSWDEGDFIWGQSPREIENKDIAGTLLVDECVKHYLKGEPLKTKHSLCRFFSETGRVVLNYEPRFEEVLGDWLVLDYTDLVKDRNKKVAS